MLQEIVPGIRLLPWMTSFAALDPGEAAEKLLDGRELCALPCDLSGLIRFAGEIISPQKSASLSNSAGFSFSIDGLSFIS